MDLESFKTQYHYKTDLVALCRQYHLPTSGTKAVLTQRLLDYLSGRPVTQPAGPSAHHQPLASHTLSLETPIVGSGFAFNQAARQFFSHYFHVEHFSFTKPMAVFKRQAEAKKDQTATIGDLIRVYQETKNKPAAQRAFLVNNPEEQTDQWNNFVRDFFADPQTARFHDRLKVAAILWQQVKRSTAVKIYAPALLTQYGTLIAEYRRS
ncbi:SAP domain-containing protein [Schleiferilactobacillus perolens]|jgi:hypothetical protein|uniref:SAP domain-containing protein n=1 Tax=Schleiferilactobacillus perolens TaxID=100468 RepID=UPI002354DC8E|nr:SAP domain-containing protein [Schleiferilactobacillus perolens]MCI2170850.1 SAP domain-containing protein [Schleiferilactobacillus perolens]